MKLRSTYKRVPEVLETIRELPERKGGSEKLGDGWSCVGTGEDNGGGTASRGERALSKMERNEW